MHMGVVLFAALLAATAHDRAFDLIGTWSCETQQGSIGTHVYARNPDGAIALVNDFRTTSGRHIVVEETFRFDAAAGRWTVTTAPDSWFGAESLSAPPWSGKEWVLDGTENTERAASPLVARGTSRIRVVYTFPAADRMERLFELPGAAAGTWDAFSTETCARTALPRG
jgi:hypothetical protein